MLFFFIFNINLLLNLWHTFIITIWYLTFVITRYISLCNIPSVTISNMRGTCYYICVTFPYLRHLYLHLCNIPLFFNNYNYTCIKFSYIWDLFYYTCVTSILYTCIWHLYYISFILVHLYLISEIFVIPLVHM